MTKPEANLLSKSESECLYKNGPFHKRQSGR